MKNEYDGSKHLHKQQKRYTEMVKIKVNIRDTLSNF